MEYEKAIKVDPHNPDEISQQLFYKGEHYFHNGDFNKALQHLLRCISAPKSASFRYLDAQALNLTGLIYIHLGQEAIAHYNLIKSANICQELGLSAELAFSYINLGYLYSSVGNYEKAMEYEKKAFSELEPLSEDTIPLKILCLAYHGNTCFFAGQYIEAVSLQEQMHQLLFEKNISYYTAATLALDLEIAHYLNDNDAFADAFQQLLAYASAHENFIESSKYYFDICDFLLKNDKCTEFLSLLTQMQTYADHIPQIFLQYLIQKIYVRYTMVAADESEYLSASLKLLDLHPQYEAELHTAISYNLEYIEQLHHSRYISDQLEKKSKLDPMTGLLSKNTLQFLTNEHLCQLHTDASAALLLVDMDHFKQINDALGHLTGDAIITDTALIIRQFFPKNAFCGRIGGDEFAIFVLDVEEPSSLIVQAELLRQEIWNQTAQRNLSIATQASIGIAFSSEAYSDYESLYHAADKALYQAKHEEHNKVIVAQ